MNMAADLLFNSCIVSCFMFYFLVDLQIIVECIPVLCLELTQNKNKLVKNLKNSNCVIALSQNSNSFLKRFDRMHPWQPRTNFKPIKLQNSLVGTKAFIKDSWRQCVRLIKAFGTKLFIGGSHVVQCWFWRQNAFTNNLLPRVVSEPLFQSSSQKSSWDESWNRSLRDCPGYEVAFTRWFRSKCSGPNRNSEPSRN